MTAYHVAITGFDNGDGCATAPFRTINRAAAVAQPGDRVIVHGGEYREWVVPQRGGLSEQRRITYEAAAGEHVVIKGSEPVTGWVQEEGTVWRARVPNSLFGTFNPFEQELDGDWMVYGPGAPRKHLGDVYLNGKSFYEVFSRKELANPERRTVAVDDWAGASDSIRDPDQTQHVWFAEVGPQETTVWANFQIADPNGELVEVNVRRSVFYPQQHHLDYITVRGFEMAHAASPWTPPTADQPGLIGPNWAKGWIIEDNEPVIERPTPYHRPHSTQVAGYAAILGGDDRYTGNIFLGGDPDQAYGPTRRQGQVVTHGTSGYAVHPSSMEEYIAQVDDPSRGDHERFVGVKQPVYLGDNVFAASATSVPDEPGALVLHDPSLRVTLVEEGDAVFLDTELPPAFRRAQSP